ncbi:hypothetical protein [Deinococcus sp. QL22]|uniref:hypothetical protein n=1 Tax=Deinococcus sp. QL22 TaxID=2939437 RepID=UPI0020180ED0|nr:hypothetical protein [Deinococcus sp. QL22]UQN04972.1 hypothetical protein M1R55_08600 [Deinococcus sp. QL22]
MKKLTLGLLALTSITLASCAPKYTAATAKPVSDMSCAEIKTEIGQLNSVRAEAEAKKGFSKENVLWAVFFLPGAVVNELDNREVIAKVDARSGELVKANSAKGCPSL